MAINVGCSAIGLVACMPGGPGIIEDKLIREIAGCCPPAVSTFLLTSRTEAPEIIRHIEYCGADTVQIVDAVNDTAHEEIRRACPNIKIVQVIHVQDERSLEQAGQYAEKADALLLDSGNPGLEIRELGGAGRIHNWDLSRKIVDICSCPVFLAGGLNPDNIGEAIQTVRPYGVDICSGVRTEGRLDKDKLLRFVAAVQAA